ncbi:unnamed protein product [Adineta steineri]|uniref:Protein CLP1 homolog n=1 Tax=Adineta steineri TaxID=433720 RepID=A0A818PI93_9BILA|nr:unnamed protein product [Adineta steineri]CAF3619344.1 unnamed protein product [Adineta steineri]CAF3751567.1 unnamed protein product [Adineta steineri]
MSEIHSFGNLPIIAHSWNKDRTQIAVSLGKNDVRIYQKVASKWKLTHTLCEHLSRVLAIDWAPKTNQIVTASADYNAYVWTFENDIWKPQMVELQRTSRAVCCAKWSPEENKFAIGSSDKNVAVCYYEKDQRFWAAEMIKKKPKSTVTCIAWHPNNQLLAIGSCDYRCRIYSAFVKTVDEQARTSNWGKITNTGELLHEFQSESGWIHDVAFSPLGDNIAWVSHNSIIFAVTADNPSQITMEITSYLPFRCIIFMNESTIIVGGHEFSPLIYNYDQRNGTIDFLEKLDRQETSTGRQSIGRLFDQPAMQTQTPEPVSTHQSMITQIVPYQKENGNLKEIVIEAGQELRGDVDETLTVELRSGKAEIFGTELAIGQKYQFTSGMKFAIFTYWGCTVNIISPHEDYYVARDENPMHIYLNVHGMLEQLRQKAETEKTRGPRIMVTGLPDVGKSTVCRMLVNWAARLGRTPILVDLDVGQNQISIPGTIAAMVVRRPASVEEGFRIEMPLVFHYGYKTPGENIGLYNEIISSMAMYVNIRSENVEKSLISGVVVNTCGYIRQEGYESFKHVAKTFDVDIIIVLDSEWLSTKLTSDLPGVKVITLPKSGGVVPKDAAKDKFRENKIREYFYGPRNNICPHVFTIEFNEIKIYKIGAPQIPDSCLPAGMILKNPYNKILPIAASPALMHHVLAVSSSNDPEQLLAKNILGFVVVQQVDSEKRTLTLLSPQPNVKNKLLIVSDISFVDMK